RVSSHSTINLSLSFPFSVTPLLPCSPLFPYPTLFRSADAAAPPARRLRVAARQPAADVHGRAEHRAALPARRHPPRHRVVRHARRHPRPRRPPQPQAARALRRPAAARRDRACAVDTPRGRLRRRAHRQPRLPLGHRGAVVPAPLGARARPDDRHGHARPRGRRLRRPRRAAGRRPHRRLDHRPDARERPRRPRRAAQPGCDGGRLMLRATLDQMRASAGRLTAAAIAILLGTAFVAASLLASATMERATHDAFTASYGDADLVVDAQGVPIGPEEVAAVRGTDGVATADVQSWFGLEVTGPRATEWVS